MAHSEQLRWLAWRAAGLAALCISGLSSFAHRAVMEDAAIGPASAWEVLFGLLSFCFASLGVLLILHGKQLFES